MRILQISSARTFGGGERHLTDLCRELTVRGHEVFAALRPTNEWQARLSLDPERVLHVSIRNSFGMFSAKRIAGYVRDHSIDIIHAHVARDYVAASAAARMSGARLVLTRHVMFPMKSFHRFALRNVDAAIAVSPPVREQLLRVFPPEKVHIVLNGLNFAGRDPAESERIGREFREFHSIPTEAFVVATMGELKVAKGQRDFVLAANEIVKRSPDVRFVVAGVDNTVDQKFRRELKRLVRVLGIEDRFLWLGWLDDTAPLLAAADVFVSPSHTESFGLAILEAMAARCAVVTTDTDGARALIGDSKAIVPVKDPLAMAETVAWYIDNEAPRRELAEQLRASALAGFSLDGMVDATEAIYRGLS